MKRIALFIVIVAAMPLLAMGEERTAILRQAQAADEVGAPLDRATVQASQRADSMRQFLRQTGREKAFFDSYHPATTQPTAAQKGVGYRALFDRAVERVSKGGEERINAGLRDLSDAQLFNEMTALQAYNIRQFVQFSRALDETAAMQRYLESVGQWKAYQAQAAQAQAELAAREAAREASRQAAIEASRKAAKPGGSATANAGNAANATNAAAPAAPKSPPAQSMEELAAALDAGPGEVDPVWARKRAKLRNSIAGSMSAANVRIATDAAETTTIAPSSSSHAAVDDPRFQPYYYGPNDGWNGWNDSFANPFVFQNGGGVYKKNDTRVNRDRDPRLNGGNDRRVNIETDRRLNIHEDPRDNF